MSEQSNNQVPATPEPEWYLNLREMHGDGYGVRIGRTFREAIRDRIVEDAKKGKVIDIEVEIQSEQI